MKTDGGERGLHRADLLQPSILSPNRLNNGAMREMAGNLFLMPERIQDRAARHLSGDVVLPLYRIENRTAGQLTIIQCLVLTYKLERWAGVAQQPAEVRNSCQSVQRVQILLFSHSPLMYHNDDYDTLIVVHALSGM